MTRTATMLTAALVAGLAAAAAGRARAAESIQIGLGADLIPVTSDFKGANLVVFGSIEAPDRVAQERGDYAIAITVRGRKEDVTIRRKERVLGVWMNRQNRIYRDVPAYYSVSATGAVDALGSPEARRLAGIGISGLELTLYSGASAADAGPAPEFAAALRAIRIRSGVFSEHPETVQYVGSSLFRANVPIPSNIPIGDYEVTAFLFKQGALVASRSGFLGVRKKGFEEFMFRLAHDHGLLHGFLAVAIALATGWLASAIFARRRA